MHDGNGFDTIHDYADPFAFDDNLARHTSDGFDAILGGLTKRSLVNDINDGVRVIGYEGVEYRFTGLMLAPAEPDTGTPERAEWASVTPEPDCVDCLVNHITDLLQTERSEADEYHDF